LSSLLNLEWNSKAQCHVDPVYLSWPHCQMQCPPGLISSSLIVIPFDHQQTKIFPPQGDCTCVLWLEHSALDLCNLDSDFTSSEGPVLCCLPNA
jgi:hypothetical protein